MCAIEIALSVRFTLEISGCCILSFLLKAHMIMLKMVNAGLHERAHKNAIKEKFHFVEKDNTD